jgi:hypothetical protein
LFDGLARIGVQLEGLEQINELLGVVAPRAIERIESAGRHRREREREDPLAAGFVTRGLTQQRGVFGPGTIEIEVAVSQHRAGEAGQRRRGVERGQEVEVRGRGRWIGEVQPIDMPELEPGAVIVGVLDQPGLEPRRVLGRLGLIKQLIVRPGAAARHDQGRGDQDQQQQRERHQRATGLRVGGERGVRHRD